MEQNEIRIFLDQFQPQKMIPFVINADYKHPGFVHNSHVHLQIILKFKTL